jgi:aspartyl-tRNA(Asn)/glutamyl-tRNA(Gln) amidotransferase subunit C
MTTNSNNVSAEDVRHVADLANLELTAQEEEAMIRDLNAILGHLDQLNELDIAEIQPMAQVSEVLGTVVRSALRPDKVEESLPRTTVMRTAPETDGVFFKVPQVMDR